MTKFFHIFDRVLDVTAYIAFALLVFSWLSVCAEVLFRYFLRSPIIWVVEVTEYILVQITFLGSAWLLKKEGHVSVDVVTSHLSPKPRTFLHVITSFICAGMFLIFTWWGTVATWGVYRDQLYIPKQVGMPKFLVMIVIPLGSLLLAVQFFRRANRGLSTWRSLQHRTERN